MFTGQIDPKVDKLLAGREVFADAERVIPVLVDSNEGSGVKKENLEGYAITKKANLLTPEQIKRLQKVVFDVETYDFNLSKRCPFHPYVGFIFEKGGKKAHALFCFQCNEVSYGRDGKQGNIEDFDSARAEILALSKEVFPQDPGLAQVGKDK